MWGKRWLTHDQNGGKRSRSEGKVVRDKTKKMSVGLLVFFCWSTGSKNAAPMGFEAWTRPALLTRPNTSLKARRGASGHCFQRKLFSTNRQTRTSRDARNFSQTGFLAFDAFHTSVDTGTHVSGGCVETVFRIISAAARYWSHGLVDVVYVNPLLDLVASRTSRRKSCRTSCGPLARWR